MEQSISRTDSSATVHMSGSFNFNDNVRFKEVFSLAENKEISSIILDMSGVTSIDSAGLGMLMILYKNGQVNNQKLSISGASGQVEKVLLLSKFDTYFRMQ